MATYINKDGLPWNFGLDEGKKGVVTGYTTDGPLRVTSIKIDPPIDLVTVDYNCKLPKGAVIKEVKSLASPDYAAGTLSIGLTGGTATGIVNAATAANLKANAAPVGAVVGTKLTDAATLTITLSAAVTAGTAEVLVSWYMPDVGDSLIWTKP